MLIKLKNILYVVLFIIQPFFGCAQFKGSKINKPDNQLSYFKLKGKVKSIHTYHKDYYYDVPDSVYQQQTIYDFNKKKYLVAETIILKEPYSKEIYHYDKKNRVIEREEWNYYRKEWQKAKSIYQYNNKGLVTKVRYKEPKGAKVLYIYDKTDNIIEEKLFRENDSIAQKRVTYKYDSNNNMIERIEYSGEVVFNRRTFQYDKHKNIIAEKVYGYSMDDLHGKFAYKYNKKNQRIEEITYSTTDTTDISHKNFYSYDKKGKILKNKQYFLGKLDCIYTYKYEFDKHKNWIKRSTYKDGKIEKVYKRKITYY